MSTDEPLNFCVYKDLSIKEIYQGVNDKNEDNSLQRYLSILYAEMELADFLNAEFGFSI